MLSATCQLALCSQADINLSTHLCTYVCNYICDWLWENSPVTHKDNYLEKRNWIIQSIISPEGLKLQACNLPLNYSYSRSIRLPSSQCIASWFSCHVFINTTSAYIWVESGGWGGATKWQVVWKIVYVHVCVCACVCSYTVGIVHNYVATVCQICCTLWVWYK